jgi:hypothetical protein
VKVHETAGHLFDLAESLESEIASSAGVDQAVLDAAGLAMQKAIVQLEPHLHAIEDAAARSMLGALASAGEERMKALKGGGRLNAVGKRIRPANGASGIAQEPLQDK